MKNKQNQETINFSKHNGRIYSDALDTYHWLNPKNQKLADDFLRKLNGVDNFFRKQEQKDRKSQLEGKGLTLGESSWKIENEEVKVKTSWWKRFF